MYAQVADRTIDCNAPTIAFVVSSARDVKILLPTKLSANSNLAVVQRTLNAMASLCMSNSILATIGGCLERAAGLVTPCDNWTAGSSEAPPFANADPANMLLFKDLRSA
jgi:hypothetical protein